MSTRRFGSLEAEFDFPPEMPDGDDKRAFAGDIAMFKKLRGHLMEIHPDWKTKIRDAKLEQFTCQIMPREWCRHPHTEAEGWLMAGVSIPRKKKKGAKRRTMKFLGAESSEVADAVAKLSLDERIVLIQGAFWELVTDIVDEVDLMQDEDEVESIGMQNWEGEEDMGPDDPWGLFKESAFREEEPDAEFFENKPVRELDDWELTETDPRDEELVQAILEERPWLRELYYAVLSGQLTEHATSFRSR